MKAFRLKNRPSGLRDFRKGIKNTGSLWLVFLSLSVSAKAENWPQWRGPEGTGHSSEQHVPVHWSTNEHVAWRVPLPGPGNSTPIVWGNRVYITQSVEADRRTVMAFDRGSGKLLWQSGVTYAEKEASHETNPQCSPSAVTDGSRVIAWFGSAGLYAYDLQGKELWHRDLGKQSHIWGYGASPVIFRNLCILNFGPGERSFLIALNSKTGETVWKVEEPGGNSGAEMPGEKPKWVGSWSTPILIRCEGREELITAWPNRVAGYQLETGHALWSCDGLNPLVYASPLYSDGIVVVMGGFMGKSLAVKANGNGDVTGQRLWHHEKTKQRIGSGVIEGKHIYVLNDPGIAECYELATGKLVWEERLVGKGSDNSSWSSMVSAEGRIYAINHSGDTFVISAQPKFELLATNSLFEPANASLALSDGQIFIRTHKALWCIGNSSSTK